MQNRLLMGAVAGCLTVSTWGCGSDPAVDWQLLPRAFVFAEFDDAPWTVDPLTGGILLGRKGNGVTHVDRCVEPWDERSAEPGLTGPFYSFDTDAAGLLILAHQQFNYRFNAILWNRQTQQIVASTAPNSTGGVFNGSGSLVALTRQADTVILSTAAGSVVATPPDVPHGGRSDLMAWSPDDDLLLGQFDSLTILESGSWKPRTLRTAERDLAAWQAQAAHGQDESGYHPAEHITSLSFSADGRLLISTMDRGLRVFRWHDVLTATESLPSPIFSVDSDLVHRGWSLHRASYTAVHDAARALILWGGLENRLHLIDLNDGREANLLELPAGVSITRLELLSERNVLCCQVTAVHDQHARPTNKLLLLDYRGLLEQLP